MLTWVMLLTIEFMVITFCFSSFLITEENILDYFIWIYWITPFSWDRTDPPPSHPQPIHHVAVTIVCCVCCVLASLLVQRED